MVLRGKKMWKVSGFRKHPKTSTGQLFPFMYRLSWLLVVYLDLGCLDLMPWHLEVLGGQGGHAVAENSYMENPLLSFRAFREWSKNGGCSTFLCWLTGEICTNLTKKYFFKHWTYFSSPSWWSVGQQPANLNPLLNMACRKIHHWKSSFLIFPAN